MIKTCAHCGKEFEGHGNAKYCPDCRHKIKNEKSLRFFHSHKKKPVEHVRHCEVCGKEFEAKTSAKYCPDCREDRYREKAREYKRRYDAARRKENSAAESKAKSAYEPKKARLAYLRKRLEQAETPKIRSRYFRQYVLLKQELLRGA